jgi:hypothetical protein
LLDVDREYREKAGHRVRMIAPRRFNPRHDAWLPVLETDRGVWHFTALYSNTPRAHSLGRTHDWVVIFFSCDSLAEGQCTVVTETRGPLVGQRVGNPNAWTSTIHCRTERQPRESRSGENVASKTDISRANSSGHLIPCRHRPESVLTPIIVRDTVRR